MDDPNDPPSLAELGWSNHFASQLEIEEYETHQPARVTVVHRNAVETLSVSGAKRVPMSDSLAEGGVAVGDWVIIDSQDRSRLLERKSGITRKSAGTSREEQMIAANVDTLFVTTSCNADFNIARLERYLVMARQASVEPVILLNKADLVDRPQDFVKRLEKAIPQVIAESLDAKNAELVRKTLAPWCKSGQTVALVGSSGVGKTTLTNVLTGGREATQTVRQDDAKGRHTTTGRSMYAMLDGGWLIDTPGMRELQLLDVADGIDAVFDDLTTLTTQCKFHDCAHESEPGCAITQAIADGRLDPDRFKRWQKLLREDKYNSETVAQSRARMRKWSKQISQGKERSKHKRKGHD